MGNNVAISGLSHCTALNGVPLTVATASSSQFTEVSIGTSNVASIVDSGTAQTSVLGHANVMFLPYIPASITFQFLNSPNAAVGSPVLVASYDDQGNPSSAFCAWTSSNTGTATINTVGEMTGVAAGSVNITCIPTGEVEFFDGASPISSCGGAGGTALNDAESATCLVSYPAVGSHQITAAYLGDNNFAGSTTTTPLTQRVGTATATALSSSRNPSPVRASVRFTAAVQAVGGGNPTGNLEFLDGGTPIASCGGTGGVVLSKSRTATCTVTFRTLGVHNIVAVYLGGGAYLPSTSDTLSQIVTRSLCQF